MARDAVLCHFDEDSAPRVIRLHLRPGGSYRGMKLPRDLSGSEVARLLERHSGYRVARSKGSHMTLELTVWRPHPPRDRAYAR